MTKIINNPQANQAWNNLYCRFEQEGLLDTDQARRRTRLLRPTAFGAIAAGIALMCAVGITLFFTDRSDVVGTDALVSLQNGKDNITLVATLEDGSIVYLANNTNLQYPEHFQSDKRQVSLQGNALFDVSGNSERPFLIDTRQVEIEVMGTAFDVKSDDGKPFELSVKRGLVKVTLKQNGTSTLVKAGQTVTRSPKGLLVTTTPNNQQFDQYTNQMRFKDEKLSDILRVVNKNLPETMIEASPTLESRRLTVSFSEDSPETMAELICLALNLKYTRGGNKLLISEP